MQRFVLPDSFPKLNRPCRHEDRAAPHLVIVEPNWQGHRFWYCRLLITEHRERTGGRTLLVTAAPALDSEQFRAHVTPIAECVDVTARRRPPHGGRLAFAMLFLRGLAEAGRTGAPVVVPDGDGALPWIAFLSRVFRRTTVSVLIMRPGTAGRSGAMKRRLIATMPTNVHCRLLVDQFGEQEVRCTGAQTVRDPLERSTVPVVAAPLWEPSLLVAGGLSERKCIAELLEATRAVGVPLTLLGRADEATRTVLSAHLRRYPERRDAVRFVDEYVSDQELDQAVQTARIVSVVLRGNTPSSGILGRAVMAGTPVVAGGNRFVAATVRRLGLGAVSRSLAVADLADAIREAMEGHSRYLSGIAAARATAHGPGEFYAAMVPGPPIAPGVAARGLSVNRADGRVVS